MHIVSVVTLLLGSIFAYSMAAPQFGGSYSAPSSGYYTLTAALANLAKELAAQRNTTVTVGNSSTIVSGISSSIANAHIDGNRNPEHGHHHHHIGWNNGYYNNVGGYWRGAAEEEGDYKSDGDDYQNGEYPEGYDIDSKDEEQEKF
ncbi:uncharacterized protein LOC117788168 [Drosophila innubila]|uniref:uncharacterized protein LOC117788168 n=1 Tax=Drosophila innubila TaxID=198719 RepID=UPI00148D6505|nr:uncharacterized protein LOC117788168 [Drosophila innubila]